MNIDIGLMGKEIEILTRDGLIFLGEMVDIAPNAVVIVRMVGEGPEMVRIRSFVAISEIIALRVREMLMEE